MPSLSHPTPLPGWYLFHDSQGEHATSDTFLNEVFPEHWSGSWVCKSAFRIPSFQSPGSRSLSEPAQLFSSSFTSLRSHEPGTLAVLLSQIPSPLLACHIADAPQASCTPPVCCCIKGLEPSISRQLPSKPLHSAVTIASSTPEGHRDCLERSRFLLQTRCLPATADREACRTGVFLSPDAQVESYICGETTPEGSGPLAPCKHPLRSA